MFPSITSRLLGRTIPSDQISEANLDGFIRLHILERDYPAVVSVEEARQKFGDLGEKSVRGVVVSGLSEKELELLDAWEADEYVKTVLPVNIDGEKRDVWVYVWNMEQYGVLLKPEVWKLEAFVCVTLSYCAPTHDDKLKHCMVLQTGQVGPMERWRRIRV